MMSDSVNRHAGTMLPVPAMIVVSWAFFIALALIASFVVGAFR